MMQACGVHVSAKMVRFDVATTSPNTSLPLPLFPHLAALCCLPMIRTSGHFRLARKPCSYGRLQDNPARHLKSLPPSTARLSRPVYDSDLSCTSSFCCKLDYSNPWSRFNAHQDLFKPFHVYMVRLPMRHGHSTSRAPQNNLGSS